MTDTDPHYLVALHLPEARRLEIGALGKYDLSAGDYVYIGRAKRGFDARLARHRRRDDKSIRWHIDYLRRATHWIGARTPEADGECALADRLASRDGAERVIDGFGASDCGCDGHLVHLPSDYDLPGPIWSGDGQPATFLERPNRFVVRIRRPSGETARAYMPNTARLTELLDEGRRLLVEPADDPDRSTDSTVRRIWDGTWVSVEATAAEARIVERLERTGELPGIGPVADWSRQVELGDYPVDFQLTHQDGRAIWFEIKSLSRCIDGDSVLSGTPSSRGVRHLARLAEVAAGGGDAALAFVIQRGDPERLRTDDGPDHINVDADWREAVREARNAGVTVLAYRCRVTPSNAWLDARIPIG